MLQITGWPADPGEVVWERLPRVESTRVTIFRGEENVSAFAHHPAIAWHRGRGFAAWSSGARDEDASGQRVLYSTSEDGRHWTPPRALAPGRPGRAYTPGGFWIRGGELHALAALRKSRDGTVESADNPLLAFRWDADTQSFGAPAPMAANFFANDAPRLAPDRHWLMLGKPGGRASGRELVRVARGGVRAVDDWAFGTLSAPEVSHDACWYVLPNGSVTAIEAAGRVPDRWLTRLDSADAGRTWRDPIRTNFPDADSRLCALRLSTGDYALLNNPNPSRYRVPLSLAVSRDGETYTALANVRVEQTNKRFSGYAKAPGYQYVRAAEHEGALWVIYSVNKEDIEVSVIPLTEISRLLASAPGYPTVGYRTVRVVDNRDAGFVSEGAWRLGTIAPGFHGPDYAFQRPAEGTAVHGWAGWRVHVAEAGLYQAYLRWATIGFSQRSEMADIVPVEIAHPAGVDRTSVDQTRYGGTWVFLGAYRLGAGEALQVRLQATARGTTVADALKLVQAADEGEMPGVRP